MNILHNLYATLVLTTLSPACQAQDTADINTDSLCIDISYMMPQRYSAKAVTNFSLCLRGDTLVSYLPYMGRAYQPTFGNTNGLDFTGPVSDKSVTKGRKGKTTIKFHCKNNAVSYDFKIEVYPKGGAYIHLIPSNADAISYRGTWQ